MSGKPDHDDDGRGDDRKDQATLFVHDGRQAVSLPRGFHLPGKIVSIVRRDGGLFLEPHPAVGTAERMRETFAKIDSIGGGPFMPEGRQQPPMPPDGDILPFDP